MTLNEFRTEKEYLRYRRKEIKNLAKEMIKDVESGPFFRVGSRRLKQCYQLQRVHKDLKSILESSRHGVVFFLLRDAEIKISEAVRVVELELKKK